jgi:hypothetical protein
MGAIIAITLCRSGVAHAQFAFVHQEVAAHDENLDPGQPEAGPAGRFVSAGFAEQEDEPKLLERQTPQWKHEAAPWVEDGSLISPTLFDGEKSAPLASPIPQVGRIHSAREWRAWRRHRRRWSDSWMFFPISVTKFSGLLETAEPVHDQIKKGEGSLTGLRLGWDFAPRLGVESRLGFARQALRDLAQTGSLGHENFILWDADLLIYPFGDRPWRPYLLAGLGIADVRYIDNQSVFWHQTLLAAPIGTGLQYRFNNRAAIRVDVVDNMLLRSSAGGGGRRLQHDLSISFGFEARFSLPHRAYFNYPHSRLSGLREFMPYRGN